MVKKFLAFSRVSWALSMEYRSQAILWMMTSLLMVIMLMVWLGVSDKGAINGFTRGDFIAYYMVGWVVRTLTAVWASWEMDYQIRQGTLSPLLLRPIHPILNEIAANLTEKIFRMAIVMPIVIIVLILSPDAHVNLDIVSLAMFVPAMIGAWMLVFLSDYLVGLLAFWTTQTGAFIMGFYGLRLLLSGIVAPLVMFPQAAQEFLKWTPFPYMLNFPTAILTHRLPANELWFGFAVQAFWVTAFIFAVRGGWRLAMRSYSAVGA
ncbi:MAG: ABC-2 family transporter protein [Chloroflexi bacterium]|nr:ABC-2 family transporter protein [Chloroflexota bacterium]